MIKRDLPSLKALLESAPKYERPAKFVPTDPKYLEAVRATCDKWFNQLDPLGRKIPEKTKKAAFAQAAKDIQKKFPDLDEEAWKTKMYALYSEFLDEIIQDME